jgi:hypothetical protein
MQALAIRVKHILKDKETACPKDITDEGKEI